MSATDQLTAPVAAVVRDHGLVLDAVSVSAAGRRRLVRIALDVEPSIDPDGRTTTATPSLSLDDVADVSRAISDLLDERDLMSGGEYVLEVTSRGLGTPLTEPRHYRRNVGRLLALTLADESVTGRVTAADDTGVDVTVTDPKTAAETARSVPYAAVTRAEVVVEFADTKDRND